VVARIPAGGIIAPPTTLKQLGAIFRLCTVVVSNDSGPMHIAAALAGRSEQGTCYYRVVTFHQYRGVDGSYGALEVSDRGRKLQIPCENIGR
jgi:hypothetical protein